MVNSSLIPNEFALKQNYPNPFNPTTKIEFALPKEQFVILKIYNTAGQAVTTLVSRRLPAGTYRYSFDARDLTSGIYFYQIQTGEFHNVKKMVLIR